MGDKVDYSFKFIIIGDSGVGKSCLMHRFTEGTFRTSTNHTIGVEYGTKVVNVKGKSVKLQIWDTAGQERFRSVTRSYYRSAAGALLVYDVAQRDTYNHLLQWLSDARSLASPDLVCMVVGNKSDLASDREVTLVEASRFAQENDLLFLETSAKTGDNVTEAFYKCCSTVLTKIDDGSVEAEEVSFSIDSKTEEDEGEPKSNCSC
mmetsp:Transcript_38138/g.98478  ORF Transcript_38138/g.98478 Transcript_38138/m.98478 type:complete len:205 (-) Transcript_38138:1167-1781(-)